MPQSTLSLARVRALVRSPLPTDQLEALFSDSKLELERIEGDRATVTVTPDRNDLLSEGGLALHLQGILGEAKGLAPIREDPSERPPPTISVDRSVSPLRPWIAGVLAVPPSGGVDAATLDEAIRFQEIVHATIGRERRRASLGIYAANRLAFPLRYALEPLDGIRFDPLGGSTTVSGEQFYSEHPMAARYGTLGRSGHDALVLRDANGELLSLPPVLNGSGAGAARAGDGPLLLEATGTAQRPVREALGLLLVVFVAQGYHVRAVGVEGGPRGPDDGRSIFAPRRAAVPPSIISDLAGASLPASEIEHHASRARLSARLRPGGWDVEVPPWRPDILGAVDVAEDVLLARGLGRIDAVIPPSVTAGRELPSTRLRRRVSDAFRGAGFTALFTTVLVSSNAVERLGRTDGSVAVENPPSLEYAFLRPSLQVSLIESLRRNTRHGYPQSYYEVGPVVEKDREGESGTRTSQHAGFVIARDRSGFAEAASRVDYLLRTLEVLGVREAATLSGTIPGRAARLRVAGVPIAEMGEIHPAVLESIKVPVPVAWGEIDLSALEPLLGRPTTV